MADLIDRKAARQIVAAYSTAEGVEKALNAIAALPAQGVRVKPLVWTAREDLNGLHEACGADGLYRNVWDQKNGTWVYEGDPTTNPPTQARFHTLDAAKAAAQADYEARILAALAPASGGVEAVTASMIREKQDEFIRSKLPPAPVEALVKALEAMVEEKVDYMTRNKLGDPEKQHTVKVARAALALIPKDGEKP
jgi:hypothetical protein